VDAVFVWLLPMMPRLAAQSSPPQLCSLMIMSILSRTFIMQNHQLKLAHQKLLSSQVQHAGFVERHIGVGSVQDEGAEDDAIFLGKLNRNPEVVRQALCGGPSLKYCRTALEAEGKSWRHASGALLFVQPWQYCHVLEALGSINLKPDSIVFSASVEYLVEESLASCRAAWLKTRRQIVSDAFASEAATASSEDVPDSEDASHHSGKDAEAANEELEYVVIVERTFVCLVPAHRAMAGVTQSSTDAHSNHGKNPRHAASSSWIEQV